uniref:Triadin n=2 Tax=Oryzias melastigma TaxID=30732 RepID=A0A3B3CJ91_ORYME
MACVCTPQTHTRTHTNTYTHIGYCLADQCLPFSNWTHTQIQIRLCSSMSHQTSSGEAASPSKSSQRSFVEEVMLTFSNPMAWLLVVALVITWSAVAVVLFDLLDYKTLTGLPPPSAIARKALRSRVGARVVKSRPAEIHGDSTAQEGNDWLDVMWTFVTGLVAPDEEEEGIHQLTETLTSLHSEEL